MTGNSGCGFHCVLGGNKLPMMYKVGRIRTICQRERREGALLLPAEDAKKLEKTNEKT